MRQIVLEGPDEAHATPILEKDIKEKNPSIQWDSNPIFIDHKVGAQPLNYQRCYNEMIE